MNTKTALVTGAASGLGYELALLLAQDAYRLVLVDVNEANLNTVKTQIEKEFNVEVIPLVKDLSKPNIAQDIVNDLGTVEIDVLINNAGFGLFGFFSETDWHRESAMIHLHVLTATHLAKLLIPGMVKRGFGKILNVSSMAAFQPGPLMTMYYATKAYQLSFSEAIANELKGTGVTVTALCPGPTKTAFQQTVSQGAKENKITFNMGSAKAVAKAGYLGMLKGKTVIVPGRINKILAFLPRILPRNLATQIVRNIQQKNRE